MLAQYQQLIQQDVLCEDKAQLAAVAALSTLSNQLVHYQAQKQSSSSLTASVSRLFKAKDLAVKGLYFYGRVGRGKTMLMDLFYQNIELKKKKRIHFHRFMEDVHR